MSKQPYEERMAALDLALWLAQQVIHEDQAAPLVRQSARDAAVALHTCIEEIR